MINQLMPLYDIGLLKFFRLPQVTINLMLEKTADNDPFYAQVVKRFYNIANARHAKLFFARQYEYGFALCRMPETFDEYYQALKKSARWNYRKASRMGYEVKRFQVNDYLEDIAEIWRSAPVRQGKMPKVIREGRVHAVNDPPSRSPYHDYFYIGVFRHGKLLAYASCAIMGELCNLNDLYGHVEYENDGLVPLLLITIAESIYTSYPSVKYYAYGTYFGARAPMRRFKRKFEFHPYRVFWELQTPADKPLPYFYIYRKLMVREQSNMPLAGGSFVMAARWSDLSRVFPLWRRKAGLYAALKWTLKILSGTRVFFGVVAGENLATYGWAHLGWCRHYSIEPDAVVLGRTLTSEAYRGKGLASGALVRIMNVLFRQGYRLFYIDTKTHNLPAQRMIAKAGFTHRIDG